MNIQTKNKTLRLLYSQETYNKVKEANILIVGVGGIGCELLKCLTEAGFRKFTLIDLDTIEFSNLNRQFYFRKEVHFIIIAISIITNLIFKACKIIKIVSS